MKRNQVLKNRVPLQFRGNKVQCSMIERDEMTLEVFNADKC